MQDFAGVGWSWQIRIMARVKGSTRSPGPRHSSGTCSPAAVESRSGPSTAPLLLPNYLIRQCSSHSCSLASQMPLPLSSDPYRPLFVPLPWVCGFSAALQLAQMQNPGFVPCSKVKSGIEQTPASPKHYPQASPEQSRGVLCAAPLTWMLFRATTPMCRKTPYSTGIGMYCKTAARGFSGL